MNRAWVIAAVTAQVAVLGYMAGVREWVVRTGDSVIVRTAPVDPRDPMRGDYVRLDYEISTVPRSLCRGGVAGWFAPASSYGREFRDRRVFARLERDDTGVAHIVTLSDEEPEEGIFLRGRVDWINDRSIRVRYGIEALFMEQGTAWEFERTMREEKAGVPINAEIAVGRGGLAVLRATSWEPLGITLRVERRGVAEDAANRMPVGERPGISGAVVTLKNHSDAPVAIVDLPDGASFRLVVSDRWGEGRMRPVARVGPAPLPTAESVLVLEPGETCDVPLDFTRPEWFVVKDPRDGEAPEAPQAFEALRNVWDAWFRIEYAPPPAEACRGLPNAELIRHSRLRSRSFNPSGGLD